MFKVGDLIAQRYQLEQLLGQRGMGRQTWRVVDRAPRSWGWGWLRSLEQIARLTALRKKTTESRSVVKFLAFNEQMTWDEFKLFEREAHILSQIDHPRIPHYQASFELAPDREIKGHWFALVQDYIPGESLQALLDRGQVFLESDIYSIATQVLEILLYLHTQQPAILHRDIKPSNLIWGSDRKIYLVDFGAGQAHESLVGVSLTIVGTSGYTPLEQFWGRSTPTSDLFALGVTLVHLLTGIAPNYLPQKEMKLQFADKVNINSRLLRWLQRMIEISPEKRFSSAQQALTALNGDRYLDSYLHLLPKDDWEILPSTETIDLKPPKTAIKVAQSENSLEIVIPSGRMHLFAPLHQSWQQGLRRQGLRSLSLATAFRLVNGFGLGLLPLLGTITLFWLPKHSISPALWLTLIGGYSGVLGLGLAFYGLARLSDRLYLRLDPENIQITRQIFGKNYIHATERLVNVLGVFTHPQGDRHQVSLNTEKEVYYLAENLKPQEAAWLAHILQKYLYYS
jgi:serine/threonine protein kinase